MQEIKGVAQLLREALFVPSLACNPVFISATELQQGVELLIGKAKVHRRGMRWLERRLVAVAEGA